MRELTLESKFTRTRRYISIVYHNMHIFLQKLIFPCEFWNCFQFWREFSYSKPNHAVHFLIIAKLSLFWWEMKYGRQNYYLKFDISPIFYDIWRYWNQSYRLFRMIRLEHVWCKISHKFKVLKHFKNSYLIQEGNVEMRKNPQMCDISVNWDDLWRYLYVML